MPLQLQNNMGTPSRDEIKAQLLDRLPEILQHLYPAGVIRRQEFEIGNIKGDRGKSMKIALRGDKAGLWHDFESGDGGDILDLWAFHHNLDVKVQFPEILKSVGDYLGMSSAYPARASSPTASWDYKDINGDLIATVHRYDTATGKTYRPWDAKAQKWQMPSPRPLYNLPGIANFARIVLTEGEKAAQALINRGIPATTAMGGANAPIEKTDWSPLKDKQVIIWPDNDAAGRSYAEKARKALMEAGVVGVSIVQIPPGKPEKWDAADAVAEHMDVRDLIIFAPPFISQNPYKAYSIEFLINDPEPIPADLISKRLLTPGGILVIGGAPKVGKSDFILSLLVHMAAGVSFLGFEPSRALRILYLQAEIQKPYLIERLRQMNMPEELIQRAHGNLFITPQMKLLLNEDGLNIVKEMISESFRHSPPDIIVIDPIRNVFDGGPDDSGMGENDNSAMLFFLQERVDRLRSEINPNAGIILIHHTRKAIKGGSEDPFQSLSGASSLRGYYSSGMIIYRPQESRPERNLVFELRNGPSIPLMVIDKANGQWIELDQDRQPIVRKDYTDKMRAERLRKQDQVIRRLYEDALEGTLYTMEQFSHKYEDVDGLGSQITIQRRIRTALTRGYIKCFKESHPLTGEHPSRSKYGFLCVEDMEVGPLDTDSDTGEIIRDRLPIQPTHFVEQGSGHVKQVENRDIWVYPPDPADTSNKPRK